MSQQERGQSQLSKKDKRDALRANRAQQLQAELRSNSRRQFLTRAGLGVLTLAGAGTGVWKYFDNQAQYQREQTEALDSAIKEYTVGSKLADVIISEADKGFANLSQRLSGKLTGYTPEEQQSLLAPIELHDANRANSVRNYYTFLLHDLEARGAKALKEPGFYSPEDPGYYFFKDLPEGQQFVGDFQPITRRMGVSPNFKGDNFYDVLVAYHETEHARQDTQRRAKFIQAGQWNVYLGLVNPELGIIVGNDEQEAYLKESMVFDALTDGKLRRDIAAGDIDVDWYVKFLNARPEQRVFVHSEIQIAREALTSGSTLKSFTPGYKQFVNLQYRSARTIVDVTSDNRVLKVR